MIPACIEVIGRDAFHDGCGTNVRFESGTKLREIGEKAFSNLRVLKAFTVPASVEILGDRCFMYCSKMTTITFEDCSRLRKIGEFAFSKCRLKSNTIPASVEEMDGSAFVGCPLLEIRVSARSRNFRVEGSLLSTADGTIIVRYFGRERYIDVRRRVEVVGNSCFESCSHLEKVLFEEGSKLRAICWSSFLGCKFLTSIRIPSSVEIIGESVCKQCYGLEECLIDDNAKLEGGFCRMLFPSIILYPEQC
jgi:hypothetical protein